MVRKLQRSFLLFASLILVLSLTNCSSRQARESYESAKKLSDEKKYAEAVKEFETVIKDYPKNEYAAKSMYELANIYGHQNDLCNLRTMATAQFF